MKNHIVSIVLLVFTLSSCKMIDLRTNYALENRTETDVEKGKRLLNETYMKMGYDKIQSSKSYQVKSVFTWKPFWAIMPMNALPGNNKNEIEFHFGMNTFDGAVKYLEGRRKGKIFGIQSFEAYKKNPEKNLKEIRGQKETWGLATYHYVIEAPARLLRADIIRYAGEAVVDGQEYDLVYVTWNQDQPHKEHDQWLVYINKLTGFTDMTQITINDFFLPMPNGMKGGTIRTERTNVNGTYLPSNVHIQLGDPKPLKKSVYKFELYNYQFDMNPLELLYPLEDVKKLGDAKR